MKEFGPDYYNITEMLTEEELLIQKTANDFGFILVENNALFLINKSLLILSYFIS